MAERIDPNDVLGMLTGVSSTQQSAAPAVAGSANFYGQFAAQQNANMTQGLQSALRGGAPSKYEATKNQLANLDPNNVADLATLAKMQMAAGDVAGAARTAAKIEAINKAKADAVKEAEAEKRRVSQEERSVEQAKAAADAVKEGTRRFKIRSDQADKQIEISRLNAEKQRKETSQRLTDASKKAIREATKASGNSSRQASSMLRLARKYDTLKPTGGAFGKGIKILENVFASQDEASAIKKEFTRITNTMIINSLPPGVASDKDIQMAQDGFLNDSWNAEQVSSFLRGQAKLAAYDAERENARALYLEANDGQDAGFRGEWEKTINSEGYAGKVRTKYELPAYNIPEEPVTYDGAVMEGIRAKAAEEKSMQEEYRQGISGAGGREAAIGAFLGQ
jgi:hypothetical protein